MKLTKKIILVLLILGSTFALVNFLYKSNGNTFNGDKLQVAASFYPYYFLASEIGGDITNVINITPAGAEPHDYEPSPGDIMKIQSSKFLIANGVIEPWISNIREGLNVKSIDIVEMDSALFSIELTDENGSRVNDPHIWLSPRLAKKQADTILTQFIKVDPQNESYYTKNARNLQRELDKLDSDFAKVLSKCKLNSIVTSHAAFGYLAKEYNFNEVPISGLSPDAEPSLKKLSEVSEFVRENNIKYIFFESLVSPKLSNAVASEVGVENLPLNPIEGLTPSDLSQGKNYLTAMRENLQNLSIAMECEGLK